MAIHVDSSKLSMYYGAYRFNPAPLMSYGQEPLTNDSGDRLADSVTLSFEGVLLNTANITSGDASAMIALRDSLIAALSGNGHEFQLYHHINSTSPQGTPIISGIYPRVEGLTFDAGIWVDQIPYSFDLSYTTNYVSGAVPISSWSDDWDFQEDNSNRSITISHSASAKGINTTVSGGASTALANARTWVLARMGVSTVPVGFPSFAETGITGNTKWERYRTEAANVTDGTYSAKEDMVMASSSGYLHNWTAQMQTDTAGVTVVTINGNVEGLGRWDAATDNAVSGWNVNVQPSLSGIANAVYVEMSGGGTLNVDKVNSLSITRDTFNGRIGYSVTYDDDPQSLPSGISEFSITKQIKIPIRKKAVFEIPSRIAGSIVHDIGTPTDGSIAINGTAKGVIDTQLQYVKEFCEDQINALRPNGALYNQLWFTEFNKTENDDQKSFSFNVNWAYTDNLSSVPDPSGEVSF
jgi:hypothetical protein